MRIDAAVLSLSWIPSEAVTGLPKQVLEAGVTRSDEPPPGRVTRADLEGLRADARFRFANDQAGELVAEAGLAEGHRREAKRS